MNIPIQLAPRCHLAPATTHTIQIHTHNSHYTTLRHFPSPCHHLLSYCRRKIIPSSRLLPILLSLSIPSSIHYIPHCLTITSLYLPPCISSLTAPHTRVLAASYLNINLWKVEFRSVHVDEMYEAWKLERIPYRSELITSVHHYNK